MVIDAVVFDLGKVLLDWNPRYLFSKLIEEEDRLEYFLTHVCTMDWIEKVDLGMPLAEAVDEQIVLHPDFSDILEAYKTRWMETIPRPIAGMVELKNALSENQYPLYSITNFGRDTFEQAVKAYPFLEEFEGMVISGHEGIKKPDARIFQILLERHKLRPETLLFIDDRLDNVEAAREQGYHAIQFIGIDQLKLDLARYNIRGFTS